MQSSDIKKQSGQQERAMDEVRLRLLVEAVEDYAIFMLDPQGYIESWNTGAERIKGYTADEIIGKHFSCFYLPEDLERDHPAHELVVAEREGKFEEEGWRLRKDGTRFWANVLITAIRDASGTLIGFGKVTRDLTERKAHEERLRSLVEAAPQIMWVLRSDGSVDYANRQWFAYTGAAGQATEALADLLFEDDREPFVSARDQAFASGHEFEIEVRLRRSDNVYRWHLARIVPVRQEGRKVGWIGTATDIEERKRAEEQMAFLAEASHLLAASLDYEEVLSQVAQLAVPRIADWCAVHVYDEEGTLKPVAVAHVDPAKTAWAREVGERYPSDPDKPHSLASVARSGEPLLLSEIPEEALVANAQDEEHLALLRRIGFRSLLAVPLQLRTHALGAIMLVWADTPRRYSEADLHFAYELAGRAAASIENARLYREARDAEARLSALNETLEERVRDRTERLQKYARDLVRSNQALERSNRELQDFAYVASHDLQEPLRKVTMFSSMLIDEAADKLGDEDREYLERMQQAAARMSALISDLLAFSRVQTQAEPFIKVPLDDVVQSVVSDLEVAIKESDATVEVGELCEVEADALQMHQLLQNLISNALKFRKPDEPARVRVEAEVREEPIHADLAPQEVCIISVKDNGIGFDVKYLNRIFAPFQRLHGREDYSGTGMGLAIVRRIVERHGGEITARSEPGEGACFIIRLPVCHTTEEEEA